MDNTKVKAQVALEFVTAFICTILFLVATAQIFVWFGNTIVNRNKAYEETRAAQWQWFNQPGDPINPVIVDFYNQSDYPLDIFHKK
ncbi:MAG: hypothetical protein PHG87_07230 [Candidatus Omnitrophica bacterium]|nr:hypothetical protein [Candidatus Omnitrophota bacterium]